jgi:hypothetical protein
MSADSIFSVVYLSEGTRNFSGKDLRELLAKARETNTKLEITGMLLFKAGNFLQVLEGDREKVLTLFEKIAQDQRHHRITVLFKGASAQRDFPDWSMGFHDLDSPDTKKIPGFTHFLRTTLTSSDFADARRAKRLLLLFKEEKLFGSAHCAIQGSK